MGEMTRIEWRCKYCGVSHVLAKSGGKPAPGRCFKRDAKTAKPHVWEKIRERA
jgi:hypothetical protein